VTRPTVLVLDGTPATAPRVGELLRGRGVEVRGVSTVEEAERALDAGEVPVAFVAVALPRGNGYDAARALRACDPRCAIFLMTSAFDVYRAERATSVGVAGRLMLPLDARAVEDAVAGLLGEPYAPPALPSVGDERVASFLPRDYARYPAVRVDPDVVGPAVERAVLEVLPEVVEAVLYNALRTSPELRARVAEAVQAALRDDARQTPSR
jgi:CheY-like chemotaxis protein